MKVWIQHHDLWSEEVHCESIDGVMAVYRKQDWQSELQKEEANKGSDRCCRPAFGMEMSANRVLQIYPCRDGRFDLHYDYSVIKPKWIIFYSTETAFLSAEGIEDEYLEEVFFLHYNLEHQLLLEFLEAFGETKELKV